MTTGLLVEHSMQMNPHSGVLPGLKVMVDRAERGQAGNDVEPREVVAPETRSRPDTAAWTFFRVRLSCSAGTGSRRSDCSCLDRPGPNTNLPGKHRSHLSSRNRPRQPPIWPGWGLITTAACFRRSRSLPFLCTSFCQDSCHRPGPCSRFDLCTRVLVAAFERQPSSRG
jgi:hypothetical protein